MQAVKEQDRECSTRRQGDHPRDDDIADDVHVERGNTTRDANTDYSADQRMAAFLVALSRRFAQRGFSATRLHLTMTRTDIANYLRLAPETVSRVLKRLQEDKLVHVDRRELEILDPARLEALALHVLRH